MSVSLYERSDYFNTTTYTGRYLSSLRRGYGYTDGRYVPYYGGLDGSQNIGVAYNLPISLLSTANATNLCYYFSDTPNQYKVLYRDIYVAGVDSWTHWVAFGSGYWYNGYGEARTWPGRLYYGNLPNGRVITGEGGWLPNGVSTTGLVGAYIGESFNPSTKIWYDVSGNNRNVQMNGGPYARRDTGINNRIMVNGGTSTNAVFFNNVIPTNYMVVHLARYRTAINRGRIFSTTSGNWLSGFWGAKAGVAYAEGWVDPNPFNNYQDPEYWILTSQRNAGPDASHDYPNLLTSSLWNYGQTTRGGYARYVPPNISINSNPFGENSDFSVACLLLYDMSVFNGDTYWDVFRPIGNYYGYYSGANFAGTYQYTYMDDNPSYNFGTATVVWDSATNTLTCNNGTVATATIMSATTFTAYGLTFTLITNNTTLHLSNNSTWTTVGPYYYYHMGAEWFNTRDVYHDGYWNGYGDWVDPYTTTEYYDYAYQEFIGHNQSQVYNANYGYGPNGQYQWNRTYFVSNLSSSRYTTDSRYQVVYL